jgi:hypothetical protein
VFDIEVIDRLDEVRVTRFRLGRKQFNTPYCGIIHTDMKKLIRGAGLINQRPPNVNLHEIVIDYGNQQSINTLFQNPQKINDLKRRIIRDTRSDIENLLQFRIKKGVVLSGHQLTELIRIQAETERLSVISIPEPIVGIFDNSWKNSMQPPLDKAIEACDIGLANIYIPIISLDQPISIVNGKIHWLIQKHVPAIGFRAVGTFARRLQRAIDILNQNEESIWVHLFDLQKKYLDISQVHLVPLLGVDTISVKKAFSRGGPPQTPIDITDFLTPEDIPLDAEEQSIETLRAPAIPRDLFEERALGFLSESQRIESFGHELTCSCPICHRARSIEVLQEMFSQLDRKALLQVHECVGFNNELNLIQQAIHNNDLNEYYEAKTLINEKREQISDRYPHLKNR